MTIILAAFICFALGSGAYFLLLMADGRKLRERLLDRKPSFELDAKEEATPLITSGYESWMSPPFGSVHPTGIAGHGSFFSVTPEPPGAD